MLNLNSRNTCDEERCQNTWNTKENKKKLMDHLNKLSNAVGFEFNKNQVYNRFRHKVKNQPGGIVVRIVRKIDMENVVEIQKKKNIQRSWL